MKKILIATFLILTATLCVVSTSMALTQTQVSQLYVGVFGRASEGEGNNYWQSDPACTSMTKTANIMLNTDAAKNYFGSNLNNNREFIKHIYLNTLGKTYTQDSAGINYWVSELEAGKTKGEVIAALIVAAQHPANAGAAQDRFNNKVEVSNYCADTIEKYTILETFIKFIEGVTDYASTVVSAKVQINNESSDTNEVYDNITDIACASDEIRRLGKPVAYVSLAGDPYRDDEDKLVEDIKKGTGFLISYKNFKNYFLTSAHTFYDHGNPLQSKYESREDEIKDNIRNLHVNFIFGYESKSTECDGTIGDSTSVLADYDKIADEGILIVNLEKDYILLKLFTMFDKDPAGDYGHISLTNHAVKSEEQVFSIGHPGIPETPKEDSVYMKKKVTFSATDEHEIYKYSSDEDPTVFSEEFDFLLNPRPNKGHSGGPIFDLNNNLIGIVKGRDETNGIGLRISAIYDEIKEAMDSENESTYSLYYLDQDGDGYGDPDSSYEDSSQPSGYVTNNTDCDDTDPSIHSGCDEIKDPIDSDTNSLVSEDFQDDPGWFSNNTANIFWDSTNKWYVFEVNDDGKIYYGTSPSFQTISNSSFSFKFDINPADPSWGTYPSVMLTTDGDTNPFGNQIKALMLTPWWSDDISRKFRLVASDQSKKSVAAFNDNIWYSIVIDYNVSTKSLTWTVTKRDSGIAFYTETLTNITIGAFNQIAVGFNSTPDYGSWATTYIDNLQLTSGGSDPTPGPPTTCGAYIAPGVWKEFDCYNLAAIGKTTNDDPFSPSWRLNGGYWQWGRKGPDSSQWYDTNTEHFAHGPTGPDSGDANNGDISVWDRTYAPDGSWFDASKTANDPCPTGYRVPTKSEWDGVRKTNTQSTVGSWTGSATNYSSARFFGNDLLLPTAGFRSNSSGSLYYRGVDGVYWSSTQTTGDNAWFLSSSSSNARMFGDLSRRGGYSVRCVAE